MQLKRMRNFFSRMLYSEKIALIGKKVLPLTMAIMLTSDGFAANFFEKSNSAANTFTGTLQNWFNISVFPIGLIVCFIGLVISALCGAAKAIDMFKLGFKILIVAFLGINLFAILVDTLNWIVNTIKGSVASDVEGG